MPDLSGLLLPAATALGAAVAALFALLRDRRQRAAADSGAEARSAMIEQQALEVADSNYMKLLRRVGELTDLWQASERKGFVTKEELRVLQTATDERLRAIEESHARELAECRSENKRLRADLVRMTEATHRAGRALLEGDQP